MKVKQIITEVQDLILEMNLSFDDLTSLHVAALKAIGDKRLDFDGATDRMKDVVYELQEFNLVDDNHNLTPSGVKAVNLAQSLGGSKERRNAAKKYKIKLDYKDYEDDPYLDDYGGHLELDGDDSIYQPNRMGNDNGHGT